MNLHTAGHRRGVVAAPHHAACEAGQQMLAEGGNAIEAMVAMAATIVAVYPHMTHIGGGSNTSGDGTSRLASPEYQERAAKDRLRFEEKWRER